MKCVRFYIHRHPLSTAKMVFHSRFELIFQSQPLCLPVDRVFAFLFATQPRMYKYTCEFRAANKTEKPFFSRFGCASVYFYSLLPVLHSMNAHRKYTNCTRTLHKHTAQAHNESERFKLRSHDYNYKYLRFRYQWIILFAHYFQEKKKHRTGGKEINSMRAK